MNFKPFLIKNYIPANMLVMFQAHVEELKKDGSTLRSDNFFKRLATNNDPKFSMFQHKFVAPSLVNRFEWPLVSSYNLLSCYLPGQGECPVHIDRPECFVTVDVCLNQLKPWPLYINSSRNFWSNGIDTHFMKDSEERERIKQTSEEFIMEPGDALCYSGTNHAHWRNRIENDNFCDLVFFHFVAKSVVGDDIEKPI
jgi:hypothetical protein